MLNKEGAKGTWNWYILSFELHSRYLYYIEFDWHTQEFKSFIPTMKALIFLVMQYNSPIRKNII